MIDPSLRTGRAGWVTPTSGLATASSCPCARIVNSQVHSAIVERIDEGADEPTRAPLILRIEPATGRRMCRIKGSVVVEREAAMSALQIRNAPPSGLARVRLSVEWHPINRCKTRSEPINHAKGCAFVDGAGKRAINCRI